jgi:hypothetical protein
MQYKFLNIVLIRLGFDPTCIPVFLPYSKYQVPPDARDRAPAQGLRQTPAARLKPAAHPMLARLPTPALLR